MNLRISPTALKDWFQYRCERKFVYESMDRDLRAQIPIQEQAVTAAWGDEGNDYERRVVEKLERDMTGTGHAVLRPRLNDDGSLTERVSRAFLSRSHSEQFAHQLLLRPTETLRSRLGLRQGIEISSGRVDLLEAQDRDGVPEFTVIDIKAAQVATLFHKIQVAFYALMLESTLAQYSIPGTLHPQGQIWHRTNSGPELWITRTFDLRGYMSLLEDFFRLRVPQLASFTVERGGRDDTPFHVYFKCEQCKFLGHCAKRLSDDIPPEQLDLSAVPGMTQQSKRTLRRLGIGTVGELVSQAGRLHSADDWALRARGATLVSRARALVAGEFLRLQGQYSLQMPPQLDRPIYVVADTDPVDGRLATLGCLIVARDGETQCHVRVIRTPAEEADALTQILGEILSCLSEVDSWNATQGDTDPLQTHIFTYESAEAADISAAIGRHLDRDAIRRGLLHLIRIFPPEQVVPEPDYRGFHHLPASALGNVVADLYALPVRVSQDLARVTQALKRVNAPIDDIYEPRDPFARRFSSRLSIEACRALTKPAPGLLAAIEEDVRARLAAMHGLARWLVHENSRTPSEARFLRLNKKPFRFRQQFDPLGSDDLDILQAQSLLDDRAALLGALTELSRPVQRRRDRLSCYADLALLRSSEDNRGNLYLVFDVPDASRQAELSAGDMGLILTDGSPDLLLNPELWPSLAVTLLRDTDGGPQNELQVKVWKSVRANGIIGRLLDTRKQGPWFIDRAHQDRNTPRIMAFLAFLARGY